MATVELSTLLDNPIWHSLNTGHASLAIGGELARRFPDDIGPLAGMAEQSPEAYRALGQLFQPDDFAVLFLDEPPNLPQGWRVQRHESIVQMVCTDPELALAAVREDLPILPLSAEDIREMLELTTLTEPGPFRQRTSSLGSFLGIRESGRLAAMAGERLALTGFREVSAVCTHPDFRGRGYAKALVAAVARAIVDRGEIPFLTSFTVNTNAIRVYESAGFTLRRKLDVVIVLPPLQ
jgi:predicted GNAT family acetyltransferase